MRRLLRAADRAHRIRGAYRHTPLWITEFGWDTDPPDPNGLRMGIAARWASEALYRAWLAGVKAFFWYELRDNPADGAPDSAVAQSGLWLRGATLADDRPKRTLEAFRFPVVAFGRARGTLVWGRTPHGRAAAVKLQARRGHGPWRGLGRVHADRSGIFRVLRHRRLGRRYFVRAIERGEASVPFSLRPVPDFYQPPFGRYARACAASDRSGRRGLGVLRRTPPSTHLTTTYVVKRVLDRRPCIARRCSSAAAAWGRERAARRGNPHERHPNGGADECVPCRELRQASGTPPAPKPWPARPTPGAQ